MIDYGIKDMVLGYQQIIKSTIENTGADSELTKVTLNAFKTMLQTLLPTKFFARFQENAEHFHIDDIDELLIFDEKRDRDNWINDISDDIDEIEELENAECRAISYEDFVNMAGEDLFDPDHYSVDSNDKRYNFDDYGALILS